MKAFEIQEFGIDQLSLAERPVSSLAFGQVLVRMKAASLNYRDWMMVNGIYNPKLRLPMIPLSDGAGIIEAIGPGVAKFREGDRVTLTFFEQWVDGPPTREKHQTARGGAIDGVLSEYVITHEDGLVHTPEHLSDVEAATLPCAGLTAWHALQEAPPIVSGETVLIQGTGGVALFALTFAKIAGARIIITSSSDEKLERARKLGAHETINYKSQPAWEKEAKNLTGGIGVDRVIELGGGKTMTQSMQAVRPGGVISLIGVLGGAQSTVDPRPILIQSLRVQGIYVGSRSMFERMNRAIELHALRPVVDRIFAWTEIKEALRYMESQQHFGKICLTWD